MSFGHFASGFADAFTETLMLQKDQERRDKMAKLQGQLVELQMKAAEQKQDAQTQVTDMMAGNTLGEFEMQPYAGMAQGQSMVADESGMQPVAPGTVQGLMPRQAPGVGEPMGLQDMMQSPEGLSALLASEQLKISDLIPKASSPNRTLELLDAAGLDPASEEGKQAMFGQDDDDLFTKMLLQNQLQQENMKLEERRRTREKEERTEAQRIRGVKADTKVDIKHTQEMFDIMQRLDGTALAVGNPVGEFLTQGKAGLNALMEATGWDVSKSQQMVVDRKRLDKLFADGTLGALDRFAGTGTVSGAKFEALQAATPNSMVPSQSNMLLLADRLEALLTAADIEGIEIDGRSEAEQLIEALRSYRPSAPAPTVDGPGMVEKVMDFTKMTLEELNQIDVDALGADELAALKARVQELKGN